MFLDFVLRGHDGSGAGRASPSQYGTVLMPAYQRFFSSGDPWEMDSCPMTPAHGMPRGEVDRQE